MYPDHPDTARPGGHIHRAIRLRAPRSMNTLSPLIDQAVAAVTAVPEIETNGYGNIDVTNGYPEGYTSPYRWPEVGARSKAIDIVRERISPDGNKYHGTVFYTAFDGWNDYGPITYKLIRGGKAAMEAIDRLAEAIKKEQKKEKAAERAALTPEEKNAEKKEREDAALEKKNRKIEEAKRELAGKHIVTHFRDTWGVNDTTTTREVEGLNEAIGAVYDCNQRGSDQVYLDGRPCYYNDGPRLGETREWFNDLCDHVLYLKRLLA